ncbi:MAG: hypothetical protein ACTTJJ_03400, partial [Prevotella fusca]|uniref:hypothetical protein n=1 Tax=Prevotella fusca TaxID=589436 RepID=UPI003FA02A5B
ATFPSWGIQRELVVGDLPVFYTLTIIVKAGAKVRILFNISKEEAKLFPFLTKKHNFGNLLHYL